MRYIGGTFVVILGAVLIAGCAVAPAPSPSVPTATVSAPSTPELTDVPGTPVLLSPVPSTIDISGMQVRCGTLAEADCRALVAAFGELAAGATDADIGEPTCDDSPCSSETPANLEVGVTLRWGEGDLKKILTCRRPAPSDPFTCERAPIDLG
jgi:hypothetical protein